MTASKRPSLTAELLGALRRAEAMLEAAGIEVPEDIRQIEAKAEKKVLAIANRKPSEPRKPPTLRIHVGETAWFTDATGEPKFCVSLAENGRLNVTSTTDAIGILPSSRQTIEAFNV